MTPLAILYVDDDEDIRHIVRLSLALDGGIALQTAGTAAEALVLLDRGPPPQVALLDVMMPGTDGLALLTLLRARPDTATLPVIFMTAKGRPADAALYRARGALGMILKPFDPLDLANQIRTLMQAGPNESG
ncbi:response regulator [Sphingomonas sp. KR1UV-12]|uniref:Response regulator n=1 Tax=Sphingomonas aurea TaxID=3063994 RepID=A0ABT9EG83_9SPHN|nr:response regulator [Sphingomonas sp. KR1UV-12]MDP1025786.1 response regulator [Sphingomonas sp. KR1UV-12]